MEKKSSSDPDLEIPQNKGGNSGNPEIAAFFIKTMIDPEIEKALQEILQKSPVIQMAMSLPEGTALLIIEQVVSCLKQNAAPLNESAVRFVLENEGSVLSISAGLIAHTEAFRKLGKDPELTWFRQWEERTGNEENLQWGESLRERFNAPQETLRQIGALPRNEGQDLRLANLYKEMMRVQSHHSALNPPSVPSIMNTSEDLGDGKGKEP